MTAKADDTGSRSTGSRSTGSRSTGSRSVEPGNIGPGEAGSRPAAPGQGLRVAMVVDRFPNETFLAQQVAELLRRSVDVHVLCQIVDPNSEAWSLLDGLDLTGRLHPWPERGRPVTLARRAAAAIAGAVAADRASLRRAVAAERRAGPGWPGRALFDARVLAIDPDVVHFQFADLARRRLHLAAATEPAFTASFRGYDLTYAGLDRPDFYRELWPRLDGAHTLGGDLQRLAVERGCPPDVDWTIIPPAIDRTIFDGGPTPADTVPARASATVNETPPLRLLSVGRLHWKKGYPDALAAVARVVAAGHQVRYRIVGTGPAEDEIRWSIRDLGLTDVVSLVGSLPPAGVRAELAAADVFLHAALTEGFGNSVLEAQSMAVPVICSDAEGLAENVVDGTTGYVVPRRDHEAMATRLLSLITYPDRRAEMGRCGAERVAERFDLAGQTDAFIAFFEAAAQARGSKRR